MEEGEEVDLGDRPLEAFPSLVEEEARPLIKRLQVVVVGEILPRVHLQVAWAEVEAYLGEEVVVEEEVAIRSYLEVEVVEVVSPSHLEQNLYHHYLIFYSTYILEEGEEAPAEEAPGGSLSAIVGPNSGESQR